MRSSVNIDTSTENDPTSLRWPHFVSCSSKPYNYHYLTKRINKSTFKPPRHRNWLIRYTAYSHSESRYICEAELIVQQKKHTKETIFEAVCVSFRTGWPAFRRQTCHRVILSMWSSQKISNLNTFLFWKLTDGRKSSLQRSLEDIQRRLIWSGKAFSLQGSHLRPKRRPILTSISRPSPLKSRENMTHLPARNNRLRVCGVSHPGFF